MSATWRARWEHDRAYVYVGSRLMCEAVDPERAEEIVRTVNAQAELVEALRTAKAELVGALLSLMRVEEPEADDVVFCRWCASSLNDVGETATTEEHKRSCIAAKCVVCRWCACPLNDVGETATTEEHKRSCIAVRHLGQPAWKDGGEK